MEIKEEMKYAIYATKLRHAKLHVSHVKSDDLRTIPSRRFKNLLKDYQRAFCAGSHQPITDQMVTDFIQILSRKEIPAILEYLQEHYS